MAPRWAKRGCDERTNHRNGYRHRDWDTSVGTIDLAVPKLREGTYYPDWLLVSRRRAEQALTSVVAQAYVEGVSTRRVDDLVEAMGIDGISASQVSRMAAELDERVAEFRDRPLSIRARTATCGSTPSPSGSVKAGGS